MSEGKSLITNVLGIEPVAKAFEQTISAALNGLSAVLGPICSPAAEEFGLLLKDKMSFYRAKNAISMTKKLEQKLAESNLPEGSRALPRLVHSIMDEAT